MKKLNEVTYDYIELNKIHEAVCSYYEIPLELKWTIFQRCNKVYIKEKRQLFHTIAYETTRLSCETIAEYPYKKTGNKWDHATICNSRKRIYGLIEFDMTLKKDYEIIKSLVRKSIKDNVFDSINKIYENIGNDGFNEKLKEFLKTA